MNTEEKEQLRIFLRRIIKLGIIMIAIKSIRWFIVSNGEIHKIYNQFIDKLPLESLIKLSSISGMILGILIIIFGFSLYRYKFLTMKACSFTVLFVILDCVFLYLFPEFPAALLRTLFLTQ